MEAAERKGDIEAQTDAVERAGFIQFMWIPGTPSRQTGRETSTAGVAL
jgi:hypothetical protein